jgi:hypothetical protein
MTNDLEQRLRSSLQRRAEDLEPTPQLWRDVQRKVARRRAVPLLVWTAAGVAAAVTAFAVVPGLLDGTRDRLDIQPVDAPTPVGGTPSEDAPGPTAGAALSHYVAVVDGRLVLRSLDGGEEVLWDGREGESEVRTLAVRPGSTPDHVTVAFVTAAEGMLELRVLEPGGEGAVAVGADPGDAAVTPTPAWSPDGRTIGLVLASTERAELVLADGTDVASSDADLARTSLAEVPEPSQLRLQDWAATPNGGALSFTAGGEEYVTFVEPAGDGWRVERDGSGAAALDRALIDDPVVDIGTGEDGTRYRLLAGVGGGSTDAADAGLVLEFDDERRMFPDLWTSSPADAWMTAVEGGAIVGLGSEARLVLRVREGDSPVARLPGVSYAAWIPVAGDRADVPKGAPTPDATGGPAAPGSTTGVFPYVAIQESGRVAVVTGDGGEREVIISEEQLASDLGGQVRPVDVTVRPGSTSGEVAGVLLLEDGDARELAWFRAAAGATALYRMEGAIGLGTDGLDQRHAPVWSPDGRHVAWVEPSDAGGWTLRTVGMADDGPTDEDAGFGLDVGTDDLVLAAWDWDQVDAASGTARGGLFLASPEGSEMSSYVVAIERQGDGSLAVPGEPMDVDVAATGIVDLGVRDHRPLELARTSDGYVVRFAGGADDVVALPIPVGTDPRDVDVDVLERWVVVTDRATGTAYAVDLRGEVTVVDGGGREVRGLDPIR